MRRYFVRVEVGTSDATSECSAHVRNMAGLAVVAGKEPRRSKAVYRGDKVTKGVWAEIIRGGYVAQEFAAPGERMVKLDGVPQARKTVVMSRAPTSIQPSRWCSGFAVN